MPNLKYLFNSIPDATLDAVLPTSGSEQERVPPRGSEVASPPIRIPFRGARKGGAPPSTTPLQYPATGKVGPESGYDILEGSAGKQNPTPSSPAPVPKFHFQNAKFLSISRELISP